jgi:hypothetical protein
VKDTTIPKQKKDLGILKEIFPEEMKNEENQ